MACTLYIANVIAVTCIVHEVVVLKLGQRESLHVVYHDNDISVGQRGLSQGVCAQLHEKIHGDEAMTKV